VAAKRMIHFPVREQGTKLFEDGFLLMYGWMAGSGTLLDLGKLGELPG
jgi:hypothetical protein